jgi:hypothetical protein
MGLLRQMIGTRGSKRSRLRREASRFRQRMIARNSGHPKRSSMSSPDREMPGEYKQLLGLVTKSESGRKALSKYRKFWGIKYPPLLEEVPGPKVTLVGAGMTTGVYLTDGTKKGGREWNVKFKGRRKIAFDPSGRKVFILSSGSQQNFGKNLRFVGHARESHYIPTRDMEKAGSFKKGKYWIHKHDDEGGRFPKVFKDSAGNFIYAPGTLRINEWMRR